jgi:hypothetical protein
VQTVQVPITSQEKIFVTALCTVSEKHTACANSKGARKKCFGTQLCYVICNQNNIVSSTHMTSYTGLLKHKVLCSRSWSLSTHGDAVCHFYCNITPCYETHKPKSMPCPHSHRICRIIRNITYGRSILCLMDKISLKLYNK